MQVRSVVCWGIAYLLLLACLRSLQVFLIGDFVDRAEFAGDVRFQLEYVAEPLQLISGRPIAHASFPPLFPVALWAAARPFLWLLPPFDAMRAAMCAFELMAWPFTWCVIVLVSRGWARHALATTMLLAPALWISDAVMCQDEFLSMAFIAAAVAATLAGRNGLAAFACGIGVVVAKVYLVIGVFAMLAVPAGRTWRQWFRDLVVAAAPIAIVEGIQLWWSASRPGGIGNLAALASFKPEATMSVNQWSLLERWLGLDPHLERLVSGALALSACILIATASWLTRRRFTPAERCALLGAMLLSVLAAFYVVNPEYYLMAVPCLLARGRPGRFAVTVALGFTLPWIVNFLYGVGVGLAAGDAGRAPFVRTYLAITSIDPLSLHAGAVVACSVMTWALAAGTAVVVLRPQADRARAMP